MKDAKFLSRIDMVALVVALAGLGLFSGTMAVMAAIDFARLVSSHWGNPDQRVLAVILGLAAIWIAARWKYINRN